MPRRVLTLAPLACIVVAVLACARDGVPHPAPAATPPVTPPSSAPTLVGDAATVPPEAMIRQLYAPYFAANELPETIADDRETLQRTFDDELTELLLADFACQRREEGVCNLDWDPFIAAQDWKLDQLAVIALEGAPGEATVEAAFDNLGERTVVRYSLVLLPRGWRIADIEYPPGGPDRPSLKATLSAPPAT